MDVVEDGSQRAPDNGTQTPEAHVTIGGDVVEHELSQK